MSRIYPKGLPDNCPESEVKVRRALSKTDGLIVLHQVNWQSVRNGKQADGEADFIIFSPGHGILILEVKGGGIDVAEGQWFTTNRKGERHEIKNPFEQAKDSKYALLNYLGNISTAFKNIKIVHAVAFPDITIDSRLGMNGPEELIIDSSNLVDIGLAVSRIFKYWKAKSNFSESELNLAVQTLLPTRLINRSLKDTINDANQSFIELTNQQIRIFRGLSRNIRAAVIGGAGSGKTILAIEKARNLSEQGFDTIFLCYNKLLKEHLQRILKGTSVRVETYHSLVVSEAKEANIDLPDHLDESWFEHDAPEILLEALTENKSAISALIIDEAQDFSELWIDSLSIMLREDTSPFYLFLDSHQDLYRRGSRIPEGLPCFELTLNCRNSTEIHTKVSNVYFDDYKSSGVSGPTPVFTELQRNSRFFLQVETLIEDLFDKGVIQEQIVILTDDSLMLSQLRELIICDWPITDVNGQGIHSETISSFKGLERDFVVLRWNRKGQENG